MTDYLLYLVIGVLVVIGTTSAFVVLYPPKRVLTSMMVITILITAPLSLYYPVLHSLGYPIKVAESITSKYIAYTVSIDSLWIYIWTIDVEVGEPRAYRIPYTKEDEERLSEAEGEKGKGIPQQVKVGAATPSNNEFAEGVLNFEPLPDGSGTPKPNT